MGIAMVIPPFLMGLSRRIHAAIFNFMAGVIPPIEVISATLHRDEQTVIAKAAELRLTKHVERR